LLKSTSYIIRTKPVVIFGHQAVQATIVRIIMFFLLIILKHENSTFSEVMVFRAGV